MKIFSNTIGRELDVDVIQKEQDGKVMTVITHASLLNIIYNELNICKDPDCIKMEDARPHSPYPVYRCTIWDKERNRCVIGIGSGKPETLTAEIASNYADESASNRAFDRAAITYLQFPGRQLSEEEVGIFLPEDITPVIPEATPMDIKMPVSSQAVQDEIVDSSPVEPIMAAPISSTTETVEEEPETPFAEAPIDNTPDVDEVEAVPTADIPADENGDFIVDFGKYEKTPTKLRDVVADEKGLEWAKKCASIPKPNAKIVDKIQVIKDYLNANKLI